MEGRFYETNFTSGSHLAAMPKLLDWCDEASVAHWEQVGAELPNWAEAYQRMCAEGKMSKVKNPSAAQMAKQIAKPQSGGRVRSNRSSLRRRGIERSYR
jgi:hypothetical protein